MSTARCRPTSRIAGPAIGALAVAVLVAVSACSSGGDSSGSTSTTAPPGQITTAPPTTAPVGPPIGAVAEGLRSVQAGQCYVPPKNDPDAEDVAVWIVDCGVPHSHEIVDVVSYDGPVGKGGRYPGSGFIKDWADEACATRFETFVGTPWTRSDLELEMWWPSPDSWDRADRRVICAVFDPSGATTTATYRNTRR